ncbi:LysE/ArgO family amino acid transporter [Marinobacterium arenosum]|uniref:LysE/ArgO family amino acid transporter n=1 Tax=Marinobacterium arenosum TaxID=2862496 RepID=UPI001C98A2D1|nr:LysE/ArgO family amino acid transporter [Marinobacterium arenosum]MBY4675167.1 LysE/ArgO family amino acid transporter [Marinobacterium arenosum]
MWLEWLIWGKGLAAGGSLIMAIGAQNAFVLSQGLKRQYHWLIATLCGLIDVMLILLGALGLGSLIQQSDSLLAVARWGGAGFLLVYGAMALRSALRSNRLEASDKHAGSLRAALLTTLAVSLLNPHVYLDTVVLLGSISSQYADGPRLWFIAGAISASLLWFYSLSLAARWLAPLFRRPIAWRILDGLVCLLMWSIAWGLISGSL